MFWILWKKPENKWSTLLSFLQWTKTDFLRVQWLEKVLNRFLKIKTLLGGYVHNSQAFRWTSKAVFLLPLSTLLRLGAPIKRVPQKEWNKTKKVDTKPGQQVLTGAPVQTHQNAISSVNMKSALLKVKKIFKFKRICFVFQANFLWKFTEAAFFSEAPMNEWLCLWKQRHHLYRQQL